MVDNGGQIGNSGEQQEMGSSSSSSASSSSPKGKSCKGYLYYSSILKANHKNPVCVGITRTLPQVPRFARSESEMEAASEGRILSDFKYGCAGYSVFLDKKNHPIDGHGDDADLPLCVGLELLIDKRNSHAEDHHTPIHDKEDVPIFAQTRTYKPQHSPQHTIGDEFFNRFTRNARLVASGVARNLHRVGNYIKDTVDDILYPYRRRGK